jgi:hypothetical protein
VVSPPHGQAAKDRTIFPVTETKPEVRLSIVALAIDDGRLRLILRAQQDRLPAEFEISVAWAGVDNQVRQL